MKHREKSILPSNRIIFYSLGAILILTSCGGGGGGGGSSEPSAPSPTVNLSAEPSSVLVGGSSTLTWSSSNASSCSASWTSSTGTSGSESVLIETPGDNTFSISCSGDGGSRSGTTSVEGYRNSDGVVVDGYISGASVFIDEDGDWIADSNETQTTSDNDGKFTIKYINGNLVSIGGIDLDSQTPLDNFLITHKLSGHSDFKVITPVTSIASFMNDASNLNTALGIDSSIDVLSLDPVLNKGDGDIYDFLYEKGNQLTVLAYALQNITNNINTSSDTTEDYFKAIAEEVETEFSDTSLRVNIETESFISKVLENIISTKSINLDGVNKDNTIAALSAILPIIQVKTDAANTVAIFDFAASTFQSDAQEIASGSASSDKISSYQTDILNYVANDQGVDADDLIPDINAFDDVLTIDEDSDVNINVLANDSYLTTSTINVEIESPQNGRAEIINNSVLYTPDDNYFGSDEFDYTISQNNKTSSASINININSINDIPTFDNLLSIYTVDENQNFVTNITASDIENDDLTITISGANSEDFNFSSSNQLTFIENPDYETNNQFQINVSVSDGMDSYDKDVEVRLNNLNDNGPIFSSSGSFSVDENEISIGSVAASDADGDIVTFSISGEDASLISINSSNGILVFNSPPDFELDKTSYSINVIASDGLFSESQNLTVAINNVNDNAPIISSSGSYSANENQLSIGSISASDADGDNLTYSASGDEIQISSEGVLTFISAPDYETKTIYSSTISVSDGINVITQDISITINNLNDNEPIFTSEETFTIEENKSTIGSINATDADIDSSITYSVDNNVQQKVEVTIEANENESGNVYVISGVQKKSLFLEVGKTYRFEHSSAHPLRFSETSNGSHGGGSEYTTGVDTTSDGLTLITVTEDTPSQLYYYCSIHSGMGADITATSNPFPSVNIDSSSGLMTFNPTPDFEIMASFSAKVSASDGEISSDQDIQINITDVDPEGPVFSSASSFSADENQTEIGTVTSEDPFGAIVTYSISGDDTDLISINSNTGVLSFNDAPDYEVKSSYSLTVTAFGSIANTQQIITININNLNDNTPKISSISSFNVDENLIQIGTIVASDADGDALTYSINGSSSLEISSSGDLAFKTAPDYENDDLTYTATVSVSDGVYSDSQDINVSINNLNDNSPEFTSSSSSFNVDENQLAIGNISASDADGNPITYSISGSDIVISQTGTLSFITAPDYEAKTSYSATITATDLASDGSNTSTMDITVSILNLNDNSPTITSSGSFTSDENQLSIGSISASDADGDTINYTITGSDILIDSLGVLTFRTAPNFENVSSYSASVTVSDLVFSETQDISIQINDINDSPIVNISSAYSGEENQTTILGAFTTSDEDGDSVAVTLGGDDVEFFEFGSDNSLTFKSIPDYETKSSYSIEFIASDGTISIPYQTTVLVNNILEGIISMDFDMTDGSSSQSPTFSASIVLDELMDATKVIVDLTCSSISGAANCGNHWSERLEAQKQSGSVWTINQTLNSSFNAGADRYFNPTLRIQTSNDYQITANSTLEDTYTHNIYSDDIGRIVATEGNPYELNYSSLSLENSNSDNTFRGISSTSGDTFPYLFYLESEDYGSSCQLIGDGVRMYAMPSSACFQESLIIKDTSQTYDYSGGTTVTGDEQIEISMSFYFGENIKSSTGFLYGPAANYGRGFIQNECCFEDISSDDTRLYRRELDAVIGIVNPSKQNIVKYTWLVDKGYGNSTNTDSDGYIGNFQLDINATDFAGNSANIFLTHSKFTNPKADEYAPNLQSLSIEPEVKDSENNRFYINATAEVNNINITDGEASSSDTYITPIKDIWFGITLPNCSSQTIYMRDETSTDLDLDTATFSRSIPIVKNLHLEGDYQVNYVNVNDRSGKANFYDGAIDSDNSSGLFPKFTLGDGTAPTCPAFASSSLSINQTSPEVFEGTTAVTTILAGATQSDRYTTTYTIDENYGYHPEGMFQINSSNGVLSFVNQASYLDLTCGANSSIDNCNESRKYTVAVRATIANRYTTNPFLVEINLVQDTDFDGIRNTTDPDDDNDGVDDEDDAFPIDASESVDTDSDGIGNNADTDDDGDGVSDDDDAFPLDSSETIDTDNDGVGNNADTDDDNDGVGDDEDSHPLDDTISDGPVVNSASYFIELRPKDSNDLTITLQGSQKDGNTLTYSIVSDVTEGLSQLDPATGELSYYTSASENSLQTIIFKANDGIHDSLHGTIEIDLRSDLLYKHSWHLKNTGQNNFAANNGTVGADLNVETDIAAGIDGSGIVVSVVDEGLEIAHEDLSPNIVANRSWDFVGNDTDPTNSSIYGDHGTSVAGIIAADGFNKIGSRGVAPDVGLIGSNFLENQAYGNEALALGYGNHPSYDENLNNIVDIFNMSYGLGYGGQYSLGGTRLSNFENTYMEYGVSNLRSGKGALYVKSSGNSWGGGCGPDGDIDMPCTEALSDPSSSSPYLIIVGALNANDVRSSYSTPGAGLWVAGYGGEYGQTDPAIMTTDQTSCDAGYAATGAYTNDFEYGQNEENPDCNYTSTFNGTSSAAPTVAGVIALMLEANIDLTWRDVKHIIAETSYQVDPTSSKELAGITQYAWVTNGANYTHHPIYGFGRIDAGAAIAAAKSYTADSMGDFVESENTFVRDTNDSSLEYEIDSSTQNQWTFTQTAIGTTDFIEFITLSFELNHTIFDDIGITLTSPSGTEIRVLTPFTDASINPNNSSFDIGVSGFYGEPLEGEWTLSVTDYTDDSVGGTMKSFTVKTYGH